MSEPADPLSQTFAVTVHPTHPQLPELTLVWMRRSADDPEPELHSLSRSFDDDVGSPALEMATSSRRTCQSLTPCSRGTSGLGE